MAFKMKGFSPFTQLKDEEKKNRPIDKLLKGNFKDVISDYRDWRKKQKKDPNLIEATLPDILPFGPGKYVKGGKLTQKLVKELAAKLKKIKKTKFWKESQKIPTVSSSDPGRITKIKKK